MVQLSLAATRVDGVAETRRTHLSSEAPTTSISVIGFADDTNTSGRKKNKDEVKSTSRQEDF